MCKDDYFQTIFNFEGPVKGPVEGPVGGPVKLQKYVIPSTGFGSLKRISENGQGIKDE